MKILECFIKTFKENIRDWKILSLVFMFAPFFIYMMYMYMGDSGSASYNVVLIDNDNGKFSDELIGEWGKMKAENGKSVLVIKTASDSLAAKEMIKNRDADLFISIPEGFSDSYNLFISSGKGTLASLKSYGDQANAKFLVASSFIDYITFSFIGQKTGIEMPIDIKYEYAGRGTKLNDFDLYVPALLILSIIMMLFTAGASIVREVEKDTITRLSLSKLSSAEFMTALTINQIIIGLICLFLTLLAAFSVGYRTSGSMPLLILVGAITCFSVISISIITSCFIKTMFGLLTMGCFPFFMLMFFSDCFLPLPKINLIRLAGHQVYINDILPTATATRAFNKILNYDSGFSDVSFEIIWILALSFVYFFIGVWLFKKKYKY
jgi:ABC-2 type transport system permease protein